MQNCNRRPYTRKEQRRISRTPQAFRERLVEAVLAGVARGDIKSSLECSKF